MPNSYSIPHLYASGTHYEVGYETGKTFKERIEIYLEDFNDFKEKIVPFTKTEKGKKIVDNYLKNLTEKFPWYIDEIKGISDGSGVSFELLFIINLRVEFMHLSNPDEYDEECDIIRDNGKECSDFHLVNDTNFLIAHNEDSSASIYHTGYLITANIVSKDYKGKFSPNEEFTCYCYPGHLPGNAFGHNASGFVFGVNALYPKLIALDRTPRQFVNRLMMGAKTLEDLENIFLYTPISYGVSLNIGCYTKDLSILKTNWNNDRNTEESLINEIIYPSTLNYEIAPNKEDSKFNIVSKHCIVPKKIANEKNLTNNFFSVEFFSHFNHYNRIPIDQCLVPSSVHREIRTKQLIAPKSQQELLELASDTGDKDLPIHRDVSPTDSAKTVATALYDIKNGKLFIYFGKPSGDYEMLLKLSI